MLSFIMRYIDAFCILFLTATAIDVILVLRTRCVTIWYRFVLLCAVISTMLHGILFLKRRKTVPFHRFNRINFIRIRQSAASKLLFRFAMPPLQFQFHCHDAGLLLQNKLCDQLAAVSAASTLRH